MFHRATPILLVTAFVAGCSSMGNKDFQCPADENGSVCMSVRDVYRATNNSDTVQPNYRDGKPIDPTASKGAVSRVDGTSSGVLANGQRGVDTGMPPLPEVDIPLPVRTPAKIMRIKIFPWQDESSDLNGGSVVFTEVEGRAWTLGEEQVSRVQQNVISPLSAPKGAGQSAYGAPLIRPPGAQVAPAMRGNTSSAVPGANAGSERGAGAVVKNP